MKEKLLTLIAIGCGLLLGWSFLACSDIGLSGDDDWTGAEDGDDDYWGGDGDADADTDADGDADSDGDAVPPEEDPEETDTDSETDEEDCDTENEKVLYLSADDSNSMAGPVVARALIHSGQKVTKAIRTYEFLNYYDTNAFLAFELETPEEGAVWVAAQMRANEEAPEGFDQTYNLQISVNAAAVAPADRRPVNLTLSLDNSGSMGSGGAIARVRDCCLAIAGSLRDGDVVSVVTWNTSQSVLLESHAVGGADDAELVEVCNSLSANGSTDLHGGLVTAYALAQANFSEDRINRVILMSDGGANVGITDAEIIAAAAEDTEGEGIYMVGVGMGSASYYNDDLMDSVTDAGKGAYFFVDSAAEAEKMFGERFLSNVEVAARDVRVELTMPPTFDMVEFHGEEYSEDPAEVEPQHLAPGDAMVYHQVIGSCDSSVVGLDDEVRIVADYYQPFTLAPDSATLDTTIGALLGGSNTMLRKGDAIVAYAEALKELKWLSGAEALTLIDATRATVQTALSFLGDDPDLIEIDGLLAEYRTQF